MKTLGRLAPVNVVALGDGLDKAVALDNDGIGGGNGNVHRLVLLQRLHDVVNNLGGYKRPGRVMQHHLSGRVGHEVL